MKSINARIYDEIYRFSGQSATPPAFLILGEQEHSALRIWARETATTAYRPAGVLTKDTFAELTIIEAKEPSFLRVTS